MSAASENTASNWNVSLMRNVSTLTSGEIAVAHVRLTEEMGVTEDNAKGDVGLLENGGAFFGITFESGTATASDGTTLLPSGKFKKDEWYAVMFILDAVNGSRIRIWQLDDPSNYGETVVSGVGGGNWKLRTRPYDGTFWLDSYFEGTPYSETITSYETTVQHGTISYVTDPYTSETYDDLKVVWNKVNSVEQRNYNGDAEFVGTKQEFLEFTTYGNITRQQEYTYDNGSDSWALYRGSRTFYTVPNTADYILDLRGRQVTLDCTGGSCDFDFLTGRVAETRFYYDYHSGYADAPAFGEFTRQRTRVQGVDFSQVDFTYDPYGNLETQTVYKDYGTATSSPGSLGQTTTTVYDTDGYNTYPISVTNQLEQTVHTSYDYDLGLPDSVTDANGVTTFASYDNFGRMTEIAAPGDSLGSAPTLKIDYINYDSSTNKPFQINLTQRVDDAAAIQLSRFYDGAGRQIQTQTRNALVNGTQENVVVDYLYDTAGRLSEQGVPWTTTPGEASYETPDLTPSTDITYDILGRTLSVTQPNNNQMQYSYTDLTTTITDPEGNSTASTADAWGRTIHVDPPTGPDVGYVYDVKGQLLKAIHGTSTQVNTCLANPNSTDCPDNKTVTIQYDEAGHKLNMTDPDMGTWEYEYDALGNLVLQTDNRQCELSLAYDNLNRLITKSSNDPDCIQQVNTSFDYDDMTNGNNGIGRRTSMGDTSGSTTWVYDARGRVAEEDKAVSGASSFTTSWTYNSADLPETMTYPDGEELTYGYNTDGSLNTVTSDTGGTYLAGTQYDEAGRIKSMEYGLGILEKTFAYFPWNTTVQGGLLDTAVTTRLGDSTALQNFEYTYDKNANIDTIIDTLAGPQTQTFGYDSLNRLTSAVVTGGTEGLYNESYEYDSNTGNLSFKSGVTYTYDANHPHAVASLSDGSSFGYDANGNMLTQDVDALFDLAYDAENRMVSVNTNSVPPTPTATAGVSPTATQTPVSTATAALTATPSADLIFADDFESGDFSAWTSSSTNGGSLSVTANASLNGNYGMQAVFANTSAMYVTDDSPSAEAHYRARFYFDPNSIAMTDGNAQYIFTGYDASSVFQVDFRFSAGEYQIRMRQYNDAGGVQSAAWVTISDAPHSIEMEWWAATAAGANDGGVTLWIDGVQSAALSGVDNDTRRVDYVRLGAVSGIDGGTLGTYYLDAFESRRSGYIGPLAQAPSGSPPLFASAAFLPVVYRRAPLQQGQSLTFNPVDDAYIASDSAATNYGSAPTLEVDNSPIKDFLLKFDVTGVNGQSVANARVRLYNENSSTNGGDFYNVSDNSWQEESVTWDSAPAADTTLLASLGSVSPGNWYEVDLTSLITGDGTYSLLISSTSSNGADYSSREGANPPELVITLAGTPTPTSTPLATDTPTDTPLPPTATFTGTPATPTNTPIPPTATATFTPSLVATDTPSGESIFTHADFIYNGDGQRVKSVMTTNIAVTTTYFVGNYHEVANGVVTKYYYAGSQRIAMRKNGTLSFMFADHLGSTSLVTDANGQNPIEIRYTAWGEVRYVSDTSPTNYTFTGQYSYTADFGLMFYNARFYSPYINHFAQPDSIIPNPANPQSWNRYSYAQNNPIRYNDPTGHSACAGIDGNCANNMDYIVRKISDDYSKDEAAILRDMLRRGGDVTYHAVDHIVTQDIHIFVEDYGENTGAEWRRDGNIYINSHGTDFTTLDGVLTSKYYNSVVGLIAHEAKHLEQGQITALSVYGEFEGWKTQLEVEREMFQSVPAYGTTRDIILNVPLTHDPDTLGWIWRAMVAEQGFDYLVWLLPLNPLNSGEGGNCGGIWCAALLAPYP